MAITYQNVEYTPPTHKELVAQALDYAQTMGKSKDRELLELKARAAERVASNLIEAGEDPQVAWNRAIRAEILETESD